MAEGLDVRLAQRVPIPLAAVLECAPGQVLALVGPSGSGKSTILRAIAGLYRPMLGRVVCNGQVWLDTDAGIVLKPRQRRVGFVFQHYGLFPHLTALENVMEAVPERHGADRARRARELLARLHLAGLEDRLPSRLSGGQQQRVGVARALAREPDVLLLDEPFSAVDRATRERLYRELAELRRELAMPAVLVTHDLAEALLLADRMSVLWHGETLQTGEPYEVMTHPRTAQVAQLVGLKNIFRGGVIGHDTEGRATLIEWRGIRLEAALQPAFAPGEQVTWTIPESQVILHRRDRPSRGERENPVSGVVGSFLKLGDHAAIAIEVRGLERPPLFMTIPMHVAQRNRIDEGVAVTVSLLRGGVHLMAADRERVPARRPGREPAAAAAGSGQGGAV
jgi:molybdate transport system ATP-binding protein